MMNLKEVKDPQAEPRKSIEVAREDTIRLSTQMKVLDRDGKTWKKVKVSLGDIHLMVQDGPNFLHKHPLSHIKRFLLPQAGKSKMFALLIDRSDPIFFSLKEGADMVNWETHLRLLLPTNQVIITKCTSISELLSFGRKEAQRLISEGPLKNLVSGQESSVDMIGPQLRILSLDVLILATISRYK